MHKSSRITKNKLLESIRPGDLLVFTGYGYQVFASKHEFVSSENLDNVLRDNDTFMILNIEPSNKLSNRHINAQFSHVATILIKNRIGFILMRKTNFLKNFRFLIKASNCQ